IILFVLVYERFVRALGSSSPHFLFCEFIFIAFDVIAYFMFFFARIKNEIVLISFLDD
ncbi:MAG: hypothetical protein ACI90V_012237, partial [Bacillariaceae sp.]